MKNLIKRLVVEHIRLKEKHVLKLMKKDHNWESYKELMDMNKESYDKDYMTRVSDLMSKDFDVLLLYSRYVTIRIRGQRNILNIQNLDREKLWMNGF